MLLFLVYSVFAIDTSYFDLDSPPQSPQYCNMKNPNKESKEWLEVIYTLSEQGRVYKSINNGIKWNDESIIFEKMGINDRFYEIQISPANKEVLYIFGENGTAIRSEDCGGHYKQYKFPKKLKDFKLNSMDDEWLLAFSNCQHCKSPFNNFLHYSTDGGNTWIEILSDVMMATWDKLIDSELIPDERIIACHLEYNKSRVTFSDDYYKSYKIIHNNGTGFFQTQYHMFVISKQESQYKLHVAPAFYDYAEMLNVSIPIEQQYSFTLLDTESEQIFLSITHNQTNKRLSNIYTSDFQGFKFTISLLNNVRSLDTGQCDFEKIESLRGVYIANIYDHEKLNRENIDNYKKTQITFNKGGIWHPLKAPNIDANGQQIICNGDCSLHLQGRSVSKIYREQKAVGLILASGNIGLYLNDGVINTYFSRDGGQNWDEVRKGHHIYAFGDRGGLIVMAKAKQFTNEIIYSWDEGLTWESVEIEKIMITSISSRSLYLNFIIMGIRQNKKGVIINIDFKTLHQRTCSGIWDPNNPDSDYEFWIPKNYDNGKCLFGQRFRYARRKRNAKCFNQQDHDKISYIDQCECTIEDWECDFGFYRKIDGGPCIPIATMFEEDEYIDILKPPEDCKDTYQKSQGYRKIVGDFCMGGVDLDPITTPCEQGLEMSKINSKQNSNNNNNNNNNNNKEENIIEIKQQQQQNIQINQNNQNIVTIIIIIIIVLIIFILIRKKIIIQNKSTSFKGENPFYKLINTGENTKLCEEEDEGGI